MKNRLSALSIMFALLMVVGVSAYDLSFIGETPANGSQIPVNDGNVFFGIETNDTITSANLWLDGIDQGVMVFVGNQSTMTLDLSGLTDNTTHSWYPILNSIVGPTYYFTVNNIPATPTGLVVFANDETSVMLDWDDNVEGDLLGYRLYRDSVLIADETTLPAGTTMYGDIGLITGTTYVYQVSAVDTVGQESSLSGPVNGVAQDTTPPTAPVITPPSGTTVNYSDVPINIQYTENVSLLVYSGGILIADLGYGDNIDWAVNFSMEQTLFYTFRGCDDYNNCLDTLYVLTYDDGAVVPLNFSIVEGTFWNEPRYFMVVDETQAGGDIVLGIEMYFNNINDIRIRMSDLVGPTTLQVNEDTQPFVFCNANAGGYWDGTGFISYVDDVIDFGEPGLDMCVDNDPSDAVNTTMYVQIPIPESAPSGSYDFSVDFNYNVTA